MPRYEYSLRETWEVGKMLVRSPFKNCEPIEYSLEQKKLFPQCSESRSSYELPDEFGMISWNLKRLWNRKQVMDQLAEYMKEGVAVIALQEATPDLVDESSLRDMSYVYAADDIIVGETYPWVTENTPISGNLILVRAGLQDSHVTRFSPPAWSVDELKGTIQYGSAVSLIPLGQDVEITTTHLPVFATPAYRRELMADILKDRTRERSLLSGDFNTFWRRYRGLGCISDFDDQRLVRELEEEYQMPLQHERSFPRGLDHICGKGVQIEDARFVNGTISDHHMIYARIRIT